MHLLVEEQFGNIGDKLRHTVARFCGSGDIAEDAVQQAFLKALMNRGLLEMMPPEAMKSWIYATAKNAAIDMVRKQKRLIYRDDAGDETEPGEGDFTEGVLVKELVDTLPEDLRAIVYLKYYSGFDSREIGAMLKIPAPTVRGRLRTAINKLRQNVREDL
ncbi:RNA polymerase subunit sigma [Clostridia bacterium]|nr:RNA polymerase subunit sigma [Clostridia bacterium]